MNKSSDTIAMSTAACLHALILLLKNKLTNSSDFFSPCASNRQDQERSSRYLRSDHPAQGETSYDREFSVQAAQMSSRSRAGHRSQREDDPDRLRVLSRTAKEDAHGPQGRSGLHQTTRPVLANRTVILDRIENRTVFFAFRELECSFNYE